jgi:hypothetical protein
MEEIVDRLFYGLFQKGFTPRETLFLIEDVVHIVSRGGEVTHQTINQRLKRLGWHEASVDPFTFELIMAFLKSHGDHENGHPTIH